MPRIKVHPEAAAQRGLAITEDIPGKAEAGRNKNTLEVDQTLGIAIDTGYDHAIRVGPVAGRNKLPDEGCWKRCIRRKYGSGRITHLACKGIKGSTRCSRICAVNGDVLKEFRGYRRIVHGLVKGGCHMLSRDLWQASGETHAQVKREARQGFPCILHVPLEDSRYRSIVNVLGSLGIRIEVTQ